MQIQQRKSPALDYGHESRNHTNWPDSHLSWRPSDRTPPSRY